MQIVEQYAVCCYTISDPDSNAVAYPAMPAAAMPHLPTDFDGVLMTALTTIPTAPFRPLITERADRLDPQLRQQVLASPGFGDHFTDHMFLAEWTPDAGWSDGQVVPYGPLQMDPASAVFHYGQEIFEGLKAYRHPDGSLWTFRPEQNAARFQRSAERLTMPRLPTDWFVGSIDALVSLDRDWVPAGQEDSLYLRPFMFGSEAFLGVRSSRRYTYAVIASPVAGYFGQGSAVSLWLAENHARAARGGTGAAKCGGNYAASLLALAEASDNGCQQAVFLDAAESRYVEELGGMNLYFVYGDGRIVTPSSDSILDGITKNSVKELATDLGFDVQERPISLQEWKDGVGSGAITEVFACGGGLVLSPVGRLASPGG